MFIISALQKDREDDQGQPWLPRGFKSSLGYLRPDLKNNKAKYQYKKAYTYLDNLRQKRNYPNESHSPPRHTQLPQTGFHANKFWTIRLTSCLGVPSWGVKWILGKIGLCLGKWVLLSGLERIRVCKVFPRTLANTEHSGTCLNYQDSGRPKPA